MQSSHSLPTDGQPALPASARAYDSSSSAGGHRAAAFDCNSHRAARNFSRRQLHALALTLLALFAVGGALLLRGCDEFYYTRAALAAPAFRTAPPTLRPLAVEPGVWLSAIGRVEPEPLPLSIREIDPADVRQAIFEALCLIGGGTGIFAAAAWVKHRTARA